MSADEDDPAPLKAIAGLLAELEKMRADPLWLARSNPVAYIAVSRAERLGHKIVRLA
jgi:hypothetical protein